ncbi:MAG: coiled-coil domain-containing protein [Planctomycetota bacterium]|jgi:chromosome segregation ATPase
MQALPHAAVALATFATGGLYFLFVRARLWRARALETEARMADEIRRLEAALAGAGLSMEDPGGDRVGKDAPTAAALRLAESEVARLEEELTRLREADVEAPLLGEAGGGSTERVDELEAECASLRRQLEEAGVHAERASELEEECRRLEGARSAEVQALNQRLADADNQDELISLTRALDDAQDARLQMEQSSRRALEEAGERLEEVDRALERAADLQAELEATRARALSFEGIAEELQRECDRLRERDRVEFEELDGSRREVVVELEAVRAREAGLGSRCAELEDEVRELSAACDALRDAPRIEPEQLAAAQAEAEAVRAELEKAAERLAEIEERAVESTLDPEAFVPRADFDGAIKRAEDAEARVSSKELELERLVAAEEELVQARKSQTLLHADLEAHKAHLEAAREELSTRRDAQREVQGELDAQVAKVAEGERLLAEARESAEELAARTDELNERAERAEERNAELLPELEAATGKCLQQSEDLEAAEREIAGAEERRHELDEALALLQVELREALDGRAVEVERVEALQADLQA